MAMARPDHANEEEAIQRSLPDLGVRVRAMRASLLKFPVT
jgi:hypothetical protein